MPFPPSNRRPSSEPSLRGREASKGERDASRSLVYDGITQHADFFNLDLDDVAGFEEDWRLAGEADAGRGTGCDDVSRHEVEDGRAIFDQPWDREDEHRRIARLYHGAVDTR